MPTYDQARANRATNRLRAKFPLESESYGHAAITSAQGNELRQLANEIRRQRRNVHRQQANELNRQVNETRQQPNVHGPRANVHRREATEFLLQANILEQRATSTRAAGASINKWICWAAAATIIACIGVYGVYTYGGFFMELAQRKYESAMGLLPDNIRQSASRLAGNALETMSDKLQSAAQALGQSLQSRISIVQHNYLLHHGAIVPPRTVPLPPTPVMPTYTPQQIWEASQSFLRTAREARIVPETCVNPAALSSLASPSRHTGLAATGLAATGLGAGLGGSILRKRKRHGPIAVTGNEGVGNHNPSLVQRMAAMTELLKRGRRPQQIIEEGEHQNMIEGPRSWRRGTPLEYHGPGIEHRL